MSLLAAAGPSAKDLYEQGRKAEREGDVVRAYLLYSHAAALEPGHPVYWLKSQSLRTRAALKAKPAPKPASGIEDSSGPPEAGIEPAPGFQDQISDEDLDELRRLKPPPELRPKGDVRKIDFRGDAKSLYEQAAKAWGLETVFDGDYQSGPALRLCLEETNFENAIRALNALTGSFIVPFSERLFFVAKDTPQKRADMEPTIGVTIPILDTVTPQEAQELARAVQQSLDILKLAVDTTRRMVLIRDRVSKVRPAQALFEQLAVGRPQVAIEVQFVELDRSAFLSYGFLMPTQFPITYIGREGSLGALQSLGRFLFGRTILGLGVADAGLFANMSETSSKNLLHAVLRSGDGQPVNFHIGDKYPIVTGGLLGGSSMGTFPSFNFEDLGLVLKIVPHVHGMEEMTLEVEAEFKVLAGQSVNGIPVISNRKFESKVRLANGEWAVIAGLMNTSEARTISGLAGLSTLPVLGRLFRQNERDRSSTEVVLLLKPRILTLPPSEIVTRGLWVGSETRMNLPL